MLHCFICSTCNGTVSDESREQIGRIARQLAHDVVKHMTNGAKCRTTPYSITLLRVVDELSSRHEILFKSIVRRLDPTESLDERGCSHMIAGIGDELFSDDQYNWGRVVTLFAFIGWLSHSLTQKTSSDRSTCCADMIADVGGNYMANKCSAWVSQQGGWVS